ncbi:hypothetical protein Slala03_80960 [Streptomyces lavendulae subsp. lavendulae]|nr:hypothetical protein Slala03_80960 [Streptomyces lavendulae subsp. lavendulae]
MPPRRTDNGLCAPARSERPAPASAPHTPPSCRSPEDGASDVSVANVTLRKDLDFQPDPQYSTASFTNCFNGTYATSSGNWGDHGSGDYYFAVNYGSSAMLWVRTLTVNY